MAKDMIAIRLGPDASIYPSRRHSSPAFNVLVETLRYRN